MMTSQDNNTTKESWEVDIRTDLWHTMSTHQLNIQRDLIVTKISTLYKFGISHQTARDILLALERALEHITKLIDDNTDPKQKDLI